MGVHRLRLASSKLGGGGGTLAPAAVEGLGNTCTGLATLLAAPRSRAFVICSWDMGAVGQAGSSVLARKQKSLYTNILPSGPQPLLLLGGTSIA